MKKTVKVAISVPNKDAVEPRAYDNHLEFMHGLGRLQERSLHSGDEQFEFFLITIPRVFPALAREKLVQYAMDDIKADFAFMWDDDMILPMDMFERLYARKVDIIAPLAFTRLPPYRPVIYNVTEGYDAVARQEYYINTSVMNYPKNTLVQCDAVGFGAVLINCDVFRKMRTPWFMTTSGAGEDIHFCLKAGKLGFKVFVDTSVKLGHISEPAVITEEVYEASEEVQKLRRTHDDEFKYKSA